MKYNEFKLPFVLLWLTTKTKFRCLQKLREQIHISLKTAFRVNHKLYKLKSLLQIFEQNNNDMITTFSVMSRLSHHLLYITPLLKEYCSFFLAAFLGEASATEECGGSFYHIFRKSLLHLLFIIWLISTVSSKTINESFAEPTINPFPPTLSS